MDKKKIILIGSIIIILVSIIASIYMISNRDEEKPENNIEGIILPENNDILKDATVENLKITNVSLLTKDGISIYKAQVLNDTENDINVDSLYVVFYEGEKAKKIPALKYSVVKANNKLYINISSETDLSKTTKIEYVIENDTETE